MSEFLRSIQETRNERFLAKGLGRIHTPEEALQFINEVGFCLFSYIPEIELPSLAKAACQEDGADIWGWKDSLPASRKVYYGSVYHPVPHWGARPGFVSLQMLAPLYSLAPILQFGGDRALLRRYTKISREAIAIAEALEKVSALPTRELRLNTGMTGKVNASRFTRALDEAQGHFLVVKIGMTSITRANYSYVWSAFESAFPHVAQLAEGLKEIEAAEAILQQYIRTALAASLERIATVLALDARLLHKAATRLVEAGTLCEVVEQDTRYLIAK